MEKGERDSRQPRVIVSEVQNPHSHTASVADGGTDVTARRAAALFSPYGAGALENSAGRPKARRPARAPDTRDVG
jgi:hypothetical protein